MCAVQGRVLQHCRAARKGCGLRAPLGLAVFVQYKIRRIQQHGLPAAQCVQIHRGAALRSQRFQLCIRQCGDKGVYRVCILHGKHGVEAVLVGIQSPQVMRRKGIAGKAAQIVHIGAHGGLLAVRQAQQILRKAVGQGVLPGAYLHRCRSRRAAVGKQLPGAQEHTAQRQRKPQRIEHHQPQRQRRKQPHTAL